MTKKLEIQNVPISQLKISEYNVRKHETDVSELAKSIEEQGVLQPIVVRPESNGKAGYGIVIGSRRFQAAKEAKLKEMPVVVQDVKPDDAITISLVENLQRNDLEPKEAAEAMAELLKTHSTRELAAKLGKGNEYVASLARTVRLQHTLEHHNIKVSNQPSDKARDEGKELPLYHAIYEADLVKHVPSEDMPESRQVEIAKAIAPIKQQQARKVCKAIEQDPKLDVHDVVEEVTYEDKNENEDNGREIPEQFPELGTEKTELTRMGDIRDASYAEWTALTGKEFMPHKTDDLLVDHIKPTREFRRSIIAGLSEDNRHGLHDWLSYTEAAINDMLTVIEEFDKSG
jgi:ParB/RepB/Spo0J family partition protein